MSEAETRKRIRAHAVAFAVVLVLALVSAGSVLAGGANPSAVLAIAVVQVFVVLFAMMHALQAGAWVRWMLAFCAVFLLALAGLTQLGLRDTINGTERVVVTPAEPQDADTEH